MQRVFHTRDPRKDETKLWEPYLNRLSPIQINAAAKLLREIAVVNHGKTRYAAPLKNVRRFFIIFSHHHSHSSSATEKVLELNSRFTKDANQ